MNKLRLGTIFLLGILLLGGLSIVPSASAFTGNEGFEDDVILSDPTSEFYTFSKGNMNSFVQSTTKHSGAKAYFANALTGTQTTTFVDFDYINAKACNAAGGGTPTSIYSFWVNINSNPTSGSDIFGIRSGSGTGGNFLVGAAISGAGAISLSSVYGSISPGVTVPLNTWFDLTMYANCTLSASGSNQYACLASQTLLINLCTNPTSTTITSATYNNLDFVIGVQTPFNRNLYIDDISVTDISSVGTTATAAYTNIIGAAADPDFNNVIIRSGTGGTDIRSLNPTSLSTIYTTATTCNRSNGVLALEDGIGWLDCTAADVDELVLADSSGNSYPLQNCIGACPTTRWNIDNLNTGGNNEEDGFDRIVPIHNQEEVDSGNGDEGIAGDCGATRIHDFGFFITGTTGGSSTVLGKVMGLTAYITETTNSVIGTCDGPSGVTKLEDNILTYTSGAVDDICSSLDILETSGDIVYAVDDAAATKGWTLTQAFDVNEGMPSVDLTIQNTYTAPSTYSASTDVSCSGGEILVGKGTTLALINPDSGVIWQKTVGTVVSVALSYDGKWGSYTDSTNTYIFNTTQGAGSIVTLATIPNPTGTVFETIIDYFGQRELIFTGTQVAEYDIHQATTITGVGHDNAPPSSSSTSSSSSSSSSSTGGCLGCTTLPESGPGSAPFGINITYVANGLGISRLGVQVMVGLILVVVFAIWMYKGTGSVIAAMFGAGLGLMVAVVMGLVPAWVIMAVVLFLILAVGKLIFGGFTGGEES